MNSKKLFSHKISSIIILNLFLEVVDMVMMMLETFI